MRTVVKLFSNVKIPILFFVLCIIMVSCAPGNEKFDVEPAGFWAGLWHGFISLITFIISLFNDKVDIYEVNNAGKLYNLGFIIGIFCFYSGSAKSSCKRKKK